MHTIDTPIFMNGTLEPSRTDDFYRSDIDEMAWESTGHVDWLFHATLISIESSDIAQYVAEQGDPWMSERRNFAPGWVIVTFDQQGIVRAYRYESEDAARADFQHFSLVYVNSDF